MYVNVYKSFHEIKGMVNQQKRLEQETACSAVVVNDHIMYSRPCLYIFSCFYHPFWVKNDIGTGIHNNYDHSQQLHYRQFLDPLVFADLPSLYTFIS